MTQDKYYHVNNEFEYNWLIKNLEREGYKWVTGVPLLEAKYETRDQVIRASQNKTVRSFQIQLAKICCPEADLIEVSELMKQDKYYHVKNEAEYNWLMKKLEREGYRWAYSKPTQSQYASEREIIAARETTRISLDWYYLDFFKKTFDKPLIEVSELMKQDEKIMFTEDEKKEFDHGKSLHTPLFNILREIGRTSIYPNLRKRILDSHDFNKLNHAQLEFARAWENPDLIVVKKPEKFAYVMKPEFQNLLARYKYVYLDALKHCVDEPEYHTAKEWRQVNDKLKVAFRRVYETENG